MIRTWNKADLKLLMVEKDALSGFAWTGNWESPMHRITETDAATKTAPLSWKWSLHRGGRFTMVSQVQL